VGCNRLADDDAYLRKPSFTFGQGKWWRQRDYQYRRYTVCRIHGGNSSTLRSIKTIILPAEDHNKKFFSGQNVNSVNVEADGTYIKHSALKVNTAEAHSDLTYHTDLRCIRSSEMLYTQEE
jgi:hypothetical protein